MRAAGLFLLFAVLPAFPARKPATRSERTGKVFVRCSTEWLRERIEDELEDRCACVVQQTPEAETVFEASSTTTPAAVSGIWDVTVRASLLRGEKVLWSDSRNWIAGTPSNSPQQVAGRLAGVLVSELATQGAFAHTHDVTQRVLRGRRTISIVAAGEWDRPVANKWAQQLRGGECAQSVVDKRRAAALLEHVEVSGPAINHINSVNVECASTANGSYCSDNLGGSSSVFCAGGACSSSGTSGDPNDARPDIQIVAPQFRWMFIDPETGQRIGTWAMRSDSIRKVRAILGCK